MLNDQNVAGVPAAAPMQLHAVPGDAPAPQPTRRASAAPSESAPVPPAEIPRAGASPPPKDKSLINRLLGAL